MIFGLWQDDAKTGEPPGYFPSGDVVFQQIGQSGSVPYPLRGFGTNPSWNPGISMQGEDVGASSDDSDVGIIENCPIGKDLDLCPKEKIDQESPESMENMGSSTDGFAAYSSEMLETSAIKGIGDPERTHDANGNGDLALCQGNPITLMVENGLHQHSEKVEITSSDVQTMDGDVKAESDEKQAVKDYVIAESDEKQTIKVNVIAESDDRPTIEGDVMAESDEKQTLGDNVMAESDEKPRIEDNVMAESNEKPMIEGNVTTESEKPIIQGNVVSESDDKPTYEDNVMAESEEQPPAKRRRVARAQEGEADVTFVV